MHTGQPSRTFGVPDGKEREFFRECGRDLCETWYSYQFVARALVPAASALMPTLVLGDENTFLNF